MAFEDAYDQYCGWTETENIQVVLSSSKLSTLIGRLFPEAKYKYIVRDGVKIGHFDNLRLRSVGQRYSSKDEEFKVPGYMETKFCVNNWFRFSYETHICENGLPLTISFFIQRTSGEFRMYVGDRRVNLELFGLLNYTKLDQIFAIGIGKIVKHMKLCLGRVGEPGVVEKSKILQTVMFAKPYMTNSGQHVLEFRRVRHPRCMVLCNFIGNAKCSSCRSCQNKISDKLLMKNADFVYSGVFDVFHADDISARIAANGGVMLMIDEKNESNGGVAKRK